jgi:trigger factor
MSNVETLGALQRRVSGFIPQQMLRGEVDARLKTIGRTAKVHGFRAGKIPAKILQQQYGAQVQQEVLGEAMQRSFAELAQANNLLVAGYPNFELKTLDLAAEQLEYSAVFEVYPEVVIGDLSGVAVVKSSFELGDAELDSTLLTLRKQRTTYQATERAAQLEDQVLIDFDGLLEGVAFDGGAAKDLTVVLGAGRMLPDFETAMTGMSAGSSKTLQMRAVSAPLVPALDAAFAESFGVVGGDVDKLKADIRENLAREVSRRLSARNKDAAMEALLQVTAFDAPSVMVQNEAQRLMQQSLRDMEERGMKMPKGMQLPVDAFVERATRRVKLGLILSELVQQHSLQAQPAKVLAMVTEYAQSFEDPEAVVRWHQADRSRLDEVEGLCVEENVVAWVMEHAKTTLTPVAFNELMGNA